MSLKTKLDSVSSSILSKRRTQLCRGVPLWTDSLGTRHSYTGLQTTLPVMPVVYTACAPGLRGALSLRRLGLVPPARPHVPLRHTFAAASFLIASDQDRLISGGCLAADGTRQHGTQWLPLPAVSVLDQVQAARRCQQQQLHLDRRRRTLRTSRRTSTTSS